MKMINTISEGQQLLQEGKIIAYPTEAVYGLGCDPFNQAAVEKLLKLKCREQSKGLIILIASWEQLSNLIKPVPPSALKQIQSSWPGHVTWVFPKAACVPDWICGDKNSIAIRMSAHHIAHGLSVSGPVVSTSANKAGLAPATTIEQLELQFPAGIDACLSGEIGQNKKPSEIYKVLTGQRLR